MLQIAGKHVSRQNRSIGPPHIYTCTIYMYIYKYIYVYICICICIYTIIYIALSLSLSYTHTHAARLRDEFGEVSQPKEAWKEGSRSTGLPRS